MADELASWSLVTELLMASWQLTTYWSKCRLDTTLQLSHSLLSDLSLRASRLVCVSDAKINIPIGQLLKGTERAIESIGARQG